MKQVKPLEQIASLLAEDAERHICEALDEHLLIPRRMVALRLAREHIEGLMQLTSVVEQLARSVPIMRDTTYGDAQ